MIQVAEIRAVFEMEVPPLRKLVRDETRINFYVNIVLKTWTIVKATPWGQQNPGLKFAAHTLSILYLMREGMVSDDAIACQCLSRFCDGVRR